MGQLQLEKIWDPVTRLWHWVLALAVILNWTFGTFMSFDTVRWHFYIGYLILGLMSFRILWGIFGPAKERFSSLIPAPSAVVQYAKTFRRREPSGTPGHNPLGSLYIMAIILILCAQALSGLFIESEDFFEYGPLNDKITEEMAAHMLGWHHFIADLILALVTFHVYVIFYYLLWKKENLIKPMFTGWKWVRRD